MSLKRFTIGALLSVCALAIPALAQKNELSGPIGRTFISDQGIKGAPSFDSQLRFGNGLSFEGELCSSHDWRGLLIGRPGASVCV
jgi:hypothetical protein